MPGSESVKFPQNPTENSLKAMLREIPVVDKGEGSLQQNLSAKKQRDVPPEI